MRTARHPPAFEVVVATAIAMFSATFVGCDSPAPGPPEKYFGGRTVDDWLVTIEKGNPRERKRAADMLGNVGPVDMRSVPALVKALRDKETRVRQAAILGLSKMGPLAVDAVPALQITLQDTDAVVRSHAAAALERIQPARTATAAETR